MLVEAAETASNGIDGAVIAAWVAAGAALTSIPANLWISHKRLEREREASEKRLEHEKEMQAERLAHERREAVLTTAAEAYLKAGVVERQLNEAAVYVLAQSKDSVAEIAEARQNVRRAKDALAIVSALGWDADVKQRASELLDHVSRVGGVAFPTVALIRDKRPSADKAVDRLERRVGELGAALEEYRKAVAGEGDE